VATPPEESRLLMYIHDIAFGRSVHKRDVVHFVDFRTSVSKTRLDDEELKNPPSRSLSAIGPNRSWIIPDLGPNSNAAATLGPSQPPNASTEPCICV